MSALGILVELIGYAVARAILPWLSFGWIYVEPFSASMPSQRGPWYRRDADGRIELRQDASGWIGFAMCLCVLFAIAIILRRMLNSASIGLAFAGRAPVDSILGARTF